ncbi:hypothetical protein MRB53_026320 [Persea americana]|uniref:Uncharacterized protein n=1 Tax=Persea americana TaxID=3435 RepID=A0ACC2LIX9_PERAE|nr:hypothetical protein MRB53_026320 [Persea americana]
MWWGKSPRRSHSLTHSSFKDIQDICKEEDQEEEEQPQASASTSAAEKTKTPRTRKASSVFHRVRIATAAVRTFNSLQTRSSPHPRPAGEKRIVVYLTSLHVVRRTFEDCRTVQSILRGFRLWIDERDLSMDSGFLEELKSILGKEDLALPQVFIGGRYLGGVEEIQNLYETGELKQVLDGFPTAKPGVCNRCGGLRFVLCGNCNGSRKYYSEKGGFRICFLCNENGLVRCPSCC